MIDLETLSLQHNAVIAVIAAIRFDRNEDHIPLCDSDNFYVRVDLDSCRSLGMHEDQDTKDWWNEQDEKIREEALGPSTTKRPRKHIREALEALSAWIKKYKIKYIWAHGSSFDPVLLVSAYRLCGMKEPWNYNLLRDTRTWYDAGGIKRTDLPKADAHHALHDCYRQIWGVKEAQKKMKK